jgi:hypothetical protein
MAAIQEVAVVRHLYAKSGNGKTNVSSDVGLLRESVDQRKNYELIRMTP